LILLSASSSEPSADYGVLLASTPVDQAAERMDEGTGIYAGMIGCFSNGGEIVVVQDEKVRGRADEDHLDSLRSLDPDGGDIIAMERS
jgi:hypothetical protein